MGSQGADDCWSLVSHLGVLHTVTAMVSQQIEQGGNSDAHSSSMQNSWEADLNRS
ncbi:hypothetical protein KSF_000660 [Reticulibacter mediterranei]|uniref:Uncharacterized protein n=1 Tax=Reticulibacter mediterranei TaxID=2778369 RepID=A0A8J3IAH8_9CHLR|nr:hypothetical protein KSF_000660 [Reticulibacter mediterranei]